jgi:hypothetical protein
MTVPRPRVFVRRLWWETAVPVDPVLVAELRHGRMRCGCEPLGLISIPSLTQGVS